MTKSRGKLSLLRCTSGLIGFDFGDNEKSSETGTTTLHMKNAAHECNESKESEHERRLTSGRSKFHLIRIVEHQAHRSIIKARRAYSNERTLQKTRQKPYFSSMCKTTLVSSQNHLLNKAYSIQPRKSSKLLKVKMGFNLCMGPFLPFY